MPRTEPIDLPAGAGIIVDRLGSVAVITAPAAEAAIVLDLGGRLNKQEDDVEHRYLFAPGQVTELIVDLVGSLQLLPADDRAKVLDQLKETWPA